MKLLFRNTDKAYVTRSRRRDVDPSDQSCVDAISQDLKDLFSLDTNLATWAIVTIPNATWDSDHAGNESFVYVNATSITSSAPAETYYLEVTTDAVDTGAPADGIVDIAADGASTCAITVTKKKFSDDTTDTSGTDTVYLMTSGGKLTDTSLTLVAGVASTTLTSANEQKVVTVEVSDSTNTMPPGSIRIQFK